MVSIKAFGGSWRMALLASCACVGTAAASVFDDARLWWKFDNGGADGAVVQASEIHDARNPSAAVPTAVNCGPTWSRMDVRLPTQRKTVNSTALYLKNQLRYTTTNQFYQANLTFSNIQVDRKDITVVARIMFDGNDVGKADCVLFQPGVRLQQGFLGNWPDRSLLSLHLCRKGIPRRRSRQEAGTDRGPVV